MAVFFTSVYRSYHDNLLKSKQIIVSAMALQEKAAKLTESTKSLIMMMDASNWDDQGVMQIKGVILPDILRVSEKMDQVELEKLKVVATMAIEELLPLLEELKAMDEEYENLVKTRNENTDPSRITNLETRIKNKIKEIDKKIIEIKNLDRDDIVKAKNLVPPTIGTKPTVPQMISSIFDSPNNTEPPANNPPPVDNPGLVRRPPNNSGGSSGSPTGPNLAGAGINERPPIIHDGKIPKIEPATEAPLTLDPNLASNQNLLRKSFHGSNFFVVKTAYDVGNYASQAYKAGIRQNSNTQRYGDLCLAFSYVHASNLYTGQGGDNGESAYRWKHAGQFRDYFNDDKKATLLKIYEQITQGKPVIMQVNGNKSGTSRHFVTVVGFKDTVTGPDSLKEEDLLIMDSWDAQIERMDTNVSRFMTTGTQTRKKYSGYYLRVLKG